MKSFFVWSITYIWPLFNDHLSSKLWPAVRLNVTNGCANLFVVLQGTCIFCVSKISGHDRCFPWRMCHLIAFDVFPQFQWFFGCTKLFNVISYLHLLVCPTGVKESPLVHQLYVSYLRKRGLTVTSMQVSTLTDEEMLPLSTLEAATAVGLISYTDMQNRAVAKAMSRFELISENVYYSPEVEQVRLGPQTLISCRCIKMKMDHYVYYRFLRIVKRCRRW